MQYTIFIRTFICWEAFDVLHFFDLSQNVFRMFLIIQINDKKLG